jgi:hypothetical protein
MKFNIKRKGIKAKWIRRGFVKIEGDKIKWLHNPKTLVCRWVINKTTKDLICNKDRRDKLQDKVNIKTKIDCFKHGGRVEALFMGTDCDNTTWEHRSNIPANVMSFLKLWHQEAKDCEGNFLGGRPLPTKHPQELISGVRIWGQPIPSWVK